jgi:hypothetical protein
VFAAATHDGYTMRLYLNGELVGSQTHIGPVGMISGVPAWIGDNASGSARGLYFRHLNQMRSAGYNDLRPFDGPLTVRSDTLTAADRSVISEELGVPLVEDPSNSSVDYSNFSPAEAATYQLYAGGATYTITTLSDSLSNRTLEADATSNPLGVFRAESNLQLNSNVRIRGVLLGEANVELAGSDIEIQSLELPALQSANEKVHLPCLCVGGRLEFLAASAVQTEGMLVVANETRFKAADSSMTATLTGRLITGGLNIEPRSPWSSLSDGNWNMGTNVFEMQRRQADGTPYFPAWLDSLGVSSNPHIQIVPTSATIRFHWHDWSEPLYLPKNDGAGLRWNIVRWHDQG